MSFYPANMDMACDFPPAQGYHGACSTILDLQRYYRRGIAYPSKATACKRVMRAADERVESDGHGNRFARRFARTYCGTFSFIMQQDFPLLRQIEEARFEAQADAAAMCDHEDELADDTEFRGETRPHFSQHINHHEP